MRRSTPSTVTVPSPAPRILAPQRVRYAHRSTISGSRAAFRMVVTPSAVDAASRIFSVAPTLGKSSAMAVPFRRPLARHSSRPPSSRISAPSWRSAARCRSIGRAPSSQPPGKDICACPVRAISAPKKMIDERISRISPSGMSLRLSGAESTATVPCERVTVQPRCRRMLTDAATSESCGQLAISLVPLASSVAASSGSALFFAPWMATAPSSRCPPSILSISFFPISGPFSPQRMVVYEAAAFCGKPPPGRRRKFRACKPILCGGCPKGEKRGISAPLFRESAENGQNRPGRTPDFPGTTKPGGGHRLSAAGLIKALCICSRARRGQWPEEHPASQRLCAGPANKKGKKRNRFFPASSYAG